MGDRGSVTVEFFLVIPLVMLVLVSAVQVVGVARARVELQGAVREGARVAATTPDPARAVEAVLAALPPQIRNRVRVSVERPSQVGVPARVTASYRHRFATPLPSDLGVELRAAATMRTER